MIKSLDVKAGLGLRPAKGEAASKGMSRSIFGLPQCFQDGRVVGFAVMNFSKHNLAGLRVPLEVEAQSAAQKNVSPNR